MGKPTSPEVITTSDAKVEADIRRMTRRSFATGAIAAMAGGSALTWLATRATEDGALWPLRRMLEFNERGAQTLYNSKRLAPEFPVEQAVEPRVNGHVGLESPVAAANWSVIHCWRAAGWMNCTGCWNRRLATCAVSAMLYGRLSWRTWGCPWP